MSVITTKSYVEYHNRGYWVAGTRISLDSVVYAFQNRQSPESIVESFPLLSLEHVYGAIAFYLANRVEIDVYLEREEAEFTAIPQPLKISDPLLYRKLIAAKIQQQLSRENSLSS
ncbi:MAG: DUF433 domain-containing protein [Cyanobacteria bacterium SBLK]|nr:DUF433 domain-containing protein [Cyanobacteria bacterium SBLK]